MLRSHRLGKFLMCLSHALLLFISAFLLSSCGGGGSTPPPPNPVPTITNLMPSTVTAGAAATTLTVNGSGFIQASVAQWNQSNRSTTFVSSTQLQVALTAADLALGGV